MAISIYQNIMSLNAQRNVGVSQSALSKSIERLSSGLRINHAADDASGLAISEKLRGQISGLQRASMNAQDGISMLQTAEGALGEVNTMLSRIRELAVQASNDRVEIQKEVEQLKDEIDRISSATEFNTKKLLNGDGTALWSASTDKIEAIIRDNVDEGNYKITLNAEPGENQVFKTDIMTLREGVIGAEITNTTANPNETNIMTVTDPNSLPETDGTYYNVAVADQDNTFTSSMAVTGIYGQSGSSFTVDTVTTVTPADLSGYVVLEMNDSFDSKTALDATTYTGTLKFIDAKTGEAGQTGSVTLTYNLAAGTLSAAGVTLENIDNDAIDFAVTLGVANGAVQAGDKVLFSLSTTDDDGAGIGVNGLVASGGGSIQITGGPANQDGPVIVFTSRESLTKADDGDNDIDTNPITVYHATINQENGNIDIGDITFNFRENTDTVTSNPVTSVGDFDIEVIGGGDAAASTTKLKDLAPFLDSDGNNLFDNKQELTIWGNGTSATIYLEGDDTITDIEQKMTDAIVNELGMGSTDNNVNSHLVDYVSDPDDSGTRTVKGTFIIQTALTGEQGEIAFSGDQRLIDGFSLNEIQESVNNTTTVTIYDAHTGDLIGTDETGNDRVYGLIGGVEVVVDSRASVTESWDPAEQEIVFTENTDITGQEYFLHIVDNSTDLQIGANEGQTLAVSIPQLDVTGLGLDDITLVSQSLAQRAIPDIDAAIDMVVSIRATIGAQINRLEHTIVNLDTAEENMTASESRIRDLDMAEEMATFTRYQMLSQAGISMLAQANQIPQMALQLLQ